jgi:hypothetical protein
MSDKKLEVLIGDGRSEVSSLLENIREDLRWIPKGYETAVVRALNRAANSGRTAAVATIRQEYAIKDSTVRRNFTIVKAGNGNLEAMVVAKGKMLPLVQYKVTPKTDTTGGARKQVRVAVKNTGLKRLGKSFVYKGRVLQRLGTAGLPVKEVYGPAIPMLANNNAVVENVNKQMLEVFKTRLEHEADYVLSKRSR